MPENDDFLELMRAEELVEGEMTAYDNPSGGQKLLVAHVGDDFFVTQEHCAHMGANLAKGKLEGTVVTCPLHHSQYDLTDGAVVRWTDWTGGLATMNEAFRHPRSLVAYETRVEDGTVYVGPEKSLAEPRTGA